MKEENKIENSCSFKIVNLEVMCMNWIHFFQCRSRIRNRIKIKWILRNDYDYYYSGQFGFLAYEQDEGKKLFFHMSEVEGGEVLQVLNS